MQKCGKISYLSPPLATNVVSPFASKNRLVEITLLGILFQLWYNIEEEKGLEIFEAIPVVLSTS
ncbi:hypothetical protein Syun_023459 [Stephania yunnanensis]|uniref:Uncharacterized protein n=1 Tax=Stephania yunnanensis TaxID=152371 RepID=A0AAP0FGV7_9MAGN